MLFEKCDTPCGTFGPKPRIILRKNIFYYMIELPYVNGKRRFFRKSLHTDNYFENKYGNSTIDATGRNVAIRKAWI